MNSGVQYFKHYGGILLRQHVAREAGLNIWDLSDAQSRALAVLSSSRLVLVRAEP